MVYVLGFEEDGAAKDLTPKYCENLDKALKLRVPVIKGKFGQEEDFWGDVVRMLERNYKLVSLACSSVVRARLTSQSLMLAGTRCQGGRPSSTQRQKEGNRDAQHARWLSEPSRVSPSISLAAARCADRLSFVLGFCRCRRYLLERQIKREEVVYPKVQHALFRGEPVYKRSNVLSVKTAETWLRHGREVLSDEEPMKWVKMRAMTIQRRRELEAEKERLGGEEVKQPLFSEAQTRVVRPPKIKDVRISWSLVILRRLL